MPMQATPSHPVAATSTPDAYAAAGVNMDTGNAVVDAIKPLAKSTRRRGADADLGGFGALFDLKACGYRDPILVSTADGVGTKVKIAAATNRLEEVGRDLVAVCVNDLVVQGAEPLFFLDYYASGKLTVDNAKRLVGGMAAACREAGCALVGGETAEMPGIYQANDFDLAGFAVGAVERDQVLPRANVQAGDVLIGLASTGLHSNGYTLARRIVAEQNLGWDAPAPFATQHGSLADALLAPTRLYVAAGLAAMRAGAKAMAHISGGGFIDNIPRVLPDNVAVNIDFSTWPQPGLFKWLQQVGQVPLADMARTFNCGIGLVIVADATAAPAIIQAARQAGDTAYQIGSLLPADGGPAVRCTQLTAAFA